MLHSKMSSRVITSLAVVALLATAAQAQPRIQWNIYGDFTFHTQVIGEGHEEGHGGGEGGGSSTFETGGVDIFARADLTDDISVLQETMIHVMPGGMAMAHSPRVYIRYRLTDWAAVKVGQTHAPLGFYSTNYPHGGYLFQMTVHRPKLVTMDMGSMIIPVHSLGVTVDGSFELGDALEIGYSVLAGNGGNSVDSDANDRKSVGGQISLRPLGPWEGLDVGASVYVDRIPKSVNDPDEIDEMILVAHMAYMAYPIEFIGEYWLIDHSRPEDPAAGPWKLQGGYAQAGWTLGRWTPYARYERWERDAEDPFYSDPRRVLFAPPVKADCFQVGLRFSAHERNVIKLEYKHELEEGAGFLYLQTAFAF